MSHIVSDNKFDGAKSDGAGSDGVISRRDALIGSAAVFAGIGSTAAGADGAPLMRAFTGKRVRYDTGRSLDEVLSHFRRLVGDATGAARIIAAGETVEEFQQAIKQRQGESGFMLFLEINHTAWLAVYGIRRKVVRLIFGNPVVAYTMLRHDIGAGLFAPVEILITDHDNGEGATVTYDLPSSLMAIEDNPPLRDAAIALDYKLAALIERMI